MKRAVLCQHGQAIKTFHCEKKYLVLQSSFTSNVRKNTSKFTYILLKLGKCGDKHAPSTDQKIAANNESLLIRLSL